MKKLTRHVLSLPGLQQDGVLSVQGAWLTAFTQVGLGNVLPVDPHAVYVLPHTNTQRELRVRRNVLNHFNSWSYLTVIKVTDRSYYSSTRSTV